MSRNKMNITQFLNHVDATWNFFITKKSYKVAKIVPQKRQIWAILQLWEFVK